jgi:hypothetical protein
MIRKCLPLFAKPSFTGKLKIHGRLITVYFCFLLIHSLTMLAMLQHRLPFQFSLYLFFFL